MGYGAIMVGAATRTVSTDYDTADRLYFEPLTAEGRAEYRRRRKAGQRAGAVRRADSAQHRQNAGGRRCADLGHVGRYD
ncbi:MAG: hypothetical protein U0521_08220 [Anaerolineae bacterium]